MKNNDNIMDENHRMTIRTAVQEAIGEIFGLDASNYEQIEALREDLRFQRKLRKAADHGFLVMVGTASVALFGIIILGIQSRFGLFMDIPPPRSMK